MLTIDLNCDMGELPELRARDLALLDIVSSANIVNGTLNVDETMQLAERAVAELAG